MKTFLIGGARSGKSSLAAQWAGERSREVCCIVTATASDDEMSARIAAHRQERPQHWRVREEPVRLGAALRDESRTSTLLLVDCLTLWISNLMHALNGDEPILAEADALALMLQHASFASIVVTDEVGMGIVPMHPMERRYRDLLGWTNQKLARVADEVLLMVAGYPLRVK